jgi:transposase
VAVVPEKPPGGAIEIELDGGVRLRVQAVVDEGALKRVLRVLGQSSGCRRRRGRGWPAVRRTCGGASTGLALLVQETLKRDPHCGHLFVFRGKRGGLIKVLWHDGQGLCLLAKRLERGRFVWPRTEGDAVTITLAQLGDLLEGIDWRLPQRSWRPEAAG